MNELAAAYGRMRSLPYPAGYRGVAVEDPQRPSRQVKLILLDADVAGCVSCFLKHGNLSAFEAQYKDFPAAAQGLVRRLAADLSMAVPQVQEAYFLQVAETLRQLQLCLNLLADPSGSSNPYGLLMIREGTESERVAPSRLRAGLSRVGLLLVSPDLSTLHGEILKQGFWLDEEPWSALLDDLSDDSDPLAGASTFEEALEITRQHGKMSLHIAYLGRLLDRLVVLHGEFRPAQALLEFEESVFLNNEGRWNDESERVRERVLSLFSRLSLPGVVTSTVRQGRDFDLTGFRLQEKNRIYFFDNPWPAGHRLEPAVWDGRLRPDGTLWFDLHLETADYCEGDPDDDEDDDEDASDWDSKIVWANYGRCKISSTAWHSGGWQVGSPEAKFDWGDWRRREVHLDPAADSLPQDQDFSERAFHIYLLGHDAVADHQLSFRALKGGWEIAWKGKIALAYTGNYELEHGFETVLEKLSFGGFRIPPEVDDEQAWGLFRKAVAKPEDWQIADHRFSVR